MFPISIGTELSNELDVFVFLILSFEKNPRALRSSMSMAAVCAAFNVVGGPASSTW